MYCISGIQSDEVYYSLLSRLQYKFGPYDNQPRALPKLVCLMGTKGHEIKCSAMPPKARVGVRLKEAVNGGKSHNRSVDLEALTQRFNVMRKKLALLVNALRMHHSLIVEMSKSRLNVSSSLQILYTKFYRHCKK
jgi:hypothetical protein